MKARKPSCSNRYSSRHYGDLSKQNITWSFHLVLCFDSVSHNGLQLLEIDALPATHVQTLPVYNLLVPSAEIPRNDDPQNPAGSCITRSLTTTESSLRVNFATMTSVHDRKTTKGKVRKADCQQNCCSSAVSSFVFGSKKNKRDSLQASNSD